ncbi:MAG: hypothetical protein MK179_11285 [Pirellulaceae bacterium]|nr:hypothetical protein [Pirellulaceae bacterium]
MKGLQRTNCFFTMVRALAAADVRDTAPVLTVLLLLLSPPAAWFLHLPVLLLGITAILYRPWLRCTPFWFVIAAIWGTSVYLHWDSADNHRYLIGYWCLALCCAFSLREEHQVFALARISRWLIGLCMAWAVMWKVVSPDYLNGAFFHYTLLLDERFLWLTELWGGVSQEALTTNRELRELLRQGYVQGVELESVQLVTSDETRELAQWLTGWTVGIEAGLAFLFLLPDRTKTSVARNWLLLLFAVTTYLVAPVKGFGWVLMLLGMGQCQPQQRFFRIAYLVVFLLIQAYTGPWSRLVPGLFG